MTDRKKIIIIGSALVGITLIIAVAIALMSPTPKPGGSEPATQDTPQQSEQEQPAEEATEEGHDMHDHGAPLPAATKEEIKKNATLAAQAFVTQEKDEKPEVRASRLSQFFSPGSPALTAAAPIGDVTYSTAQVTVVESSWYDLQKEGAIGVIVYLNVAVETGFGDYEEYQTWVIESAPYENAWLARDIFKSDLQYIQGVN